MTERINLINISEIRSIQLSILDYVVSFLDNNNIRYFLGYGTLIGAIRHATYIPWDDDIDIVMLRSDYEKLLSLSDELSNDEFELKHNRIDKGFKYSFMKIVHKGSVIIEPNKFVEVPIGINIDVFPMDNFKSDRLILKAYLFLNQLFQRILDIKCLNFSIKRSTHKNVVIAVFKLFSLPFNTNWLTRIIDHFGAKMSTEPSDKVANLVYSNYRYDYAARDAFDDVVKVRFEGKFYSAPIGFDEWLTNYYGDYMQLPPEDNRVSHHSYEAYIVSEG